MVRELDLPIRVVGIPVVRECDGLAMSSRNVYLNETERQIAPELHRTMRMVAIRLSRGAKLESQCQWGNDTLLAAGFDRIDYFEVCDSQTLQRAKGFQPRSCNVEMTAAMCPFIIFHLDSCLSFTTSGLQIF